MLCLKSWIWCSTCVNFKPLIERKKHDHKSPCEKIIDYNKWSQIFTNYDPINNKCKDYEVTYENCLQCNYKYKCLTKEYI